VYLLDNPAECGNLPHLAAAVGFETNLPECTKAQRLGLIALSEAKLQAWLNREKLKKMPDYCWAKEICELSGLLLGRNPVMLHSRSEVSNCLFKTPDAMVVVFMLSRPAVRTFAIFFEE